MLNIRTIADRRTPAGSTSGAGRAAVVGGHGGPLEGLTLVRHQVSFRAGYAQCGRSAAIRDRPEQFQLTVAGPSLSIPAAPIVGGSTGHQRRAPWTEQKGQQMAQYAILIYEDEAGWAAGGPAAEQGMKGHQEFGTNYAAVLRGGAALQPTSTATSIRGQSSGDLAVTDGPFAETKEALGGFYLIEAADLDEAIAVAKAVPAPFGGVEVRPVQVFD